MPYSYTLEGDVEDVSRQHIANRASLTVHPAPWYIGVRRPPYFIEQKNGLKTEVVAVEPDGTIAAGVPVDRHADADSVEQRAPRRRQRLLHLGHRAQEGAGRIVDGHDRRDAGRRSTSRSRTAATSCSRRAPTATPAASPLTTHVVLCARRRLHRVGALRSQPHRPRAGAQDLQAGRDRADHDPVALGAGDGAGHDRA